ncbi:MAG: cytochrome c oxidase subunit II [Ilumatobacteraceae bacterium]
MERRTPLRRLRAVALGGLAVLGLSACAQNAPQDTWDPAGDNAQQIHDLQWPVFAVAGIVGLIVMAAVAYCVFRFRDRGQPIPEQTHGKAWLEYLFIAIPAAILVGVGVPTVSVVLALNETDDTECVVNVTGQQWWWEYDYPVDADGMICGEYQHTDGETLPIITSGQMVIPTDTNVLIRGTSRDVIHSFWVPRLNGKRDMVPGRVHTWRFQAWEPGIYAGQCAEFCGLSHANMRMEIVALDPPDFQKWLDNQLEAYQSPEEGTLAATGEATFVSQCSRCHQVDGLTDANGDLIVSAPDQFVWSGAAPNLSNLMTRNTFAGATWDLVTEACRNDIWESAPEEFGAK